MDWIRNNRGAAVGAGFVALLVVGFLAFGVFGIQTAFLDDEVAEDAPVFESGAASDIASDVVDAETTADMNEVMANESISSMVEVDEDMPTEPDEPSAEAENAETGTDEPEIGVIRELSSGRFVPRSHPGEGLASVLNDGTEQRFLRFEEFSTDNGPDLFVYLTSADADAESGRFGVDGGFVDLGRLKGNVGDQNYEIPVDVDLDEFDTVVVWCRRFGVAFTAADLSPTA